MSGVNELDKAALRSEFRRLYREIGLSGMLQVIYELLISAEVCCEVTEEERAKEG